MSHPLDAFERIYVINLPSRSDRRLEMAEQLSRIGLVLGSSRVRLFEAVRPDGAGGFPNRGAHGCFMSHLGVLREAAADRLTRVLILEDDLNFSDDFLERAPAALARAASAECAIFYGGYEVESLPPSSAATVEPLRLKTNAPGSEPASVAYQSLAETATCGSAVSLSLMVIVTALTPLGR